MLLEARAGAELLRLLGMMIWECNTDRMLTLALSRGNSLAPGGELAR